MSDYEDIVGPQCPDPEISDKIREHFSKESSVSQKPEPVSAIEIERTKKELEILSSASGHSREALLNYMGQLKASGYLVPSGYESWTDRSLDFYLRQRALSAQERLEDLAS